jgi:hypothetical protein
VSRLTGHGVAGQIGGQSVIGKGPDITPKSVLIAVNSAVGAKRSFLYRGLRKGDALRSVSSGLWERPASDLEPLLEKMMQTLRDCRVQIRYQLKGAASGYVKSLSSYEGVLTLVETGPALPSVGDCVTFQRVPLAKFPWLKGNWVVRQVVGNGFLIPYVFPPFPAPQVLVNTTWKKVSYGYSPITDWLLDNDLRTRKTGRPVCPTRGRSRGIRFR